MLTCYIIFKILKPTLKIFNIKNEFECNSTVSNEIRDFKINFQNYKN